MNSKYAFKEIGNDVEIFEPISIVQQDNITLKSHIRLSEFSLIFGGSGIHIGNFVHIANHVSIIGGGVCVLEDFVGICAGVRIITGSDTISGEGIPSPLVSDKFRSYYRSHVICKKHSFIGTNVIIHPGVTIGEGVVVASGSIVTKDLEPWGVYIGMPAKKRNERPKESILKMEEKVYEENKMVASDFNDVIQCTIN